VPFESLGELHLRYLKGLPGPYCIATSEFDERVQREYEGEPISEPDYHSAIESGVPACQCGGQFKFGAPPRCPECQSTSLDIDEVPRCLYD
jgi:hypothetical protein